MKLISWNVNGLRACVKKGFLDIKANEQSMPFSNELYFASKSIILFTSFPSIESIISPTFIPALPLGPELSTLTTYIPLSSLIF